MSVKNLEYVLGLNTRSQDAACHSALFTDGGLVDEWVKTRRVTGCVELQACIVLGDQCIQKTGPKCRAL